MQTSNPSQPVSVSLWPSIGEAVITHRRNGSNAARFKGFDDLAAPTVKVGDPPDRASPAASPDRCEDPETSESLNLDIRTQLNQDRSARRRRTNIRRASKHIEANRMITFTTRPSDNIYTTSELWTEFRMTRRRFLRAGVTFPDWVAVPELHSSARTSEAKRGSLHLHVLLGEYIDLEAAHRFWVLGGVQLAHRAQAPSRDVAERLSSYLAGYAAKESANLVMRRQAGGVAPKLWGRSSGAIPPVHSFGCGDVPAALEMISGTLGPVQSMYLEASESGRPECWIVNAR